MSWARRTAYGVVRKQENVETRVLCSEGPCKQFRAERVRVIVETVRVKDVAEREGNIGKQIVQINGYKHNIEVLRKKVWEQAVFLR